MIIGNLTKDPEVRTTSNGVDVCSFTVAVNRRKGQQQEADFFRVNAWRERAKVCGQYLAKGRKVCVVGPVSVKTYQGNDGATRASLEVTAEEVEFLSSKGETEEKKDAQTGYAQVEMDSLPWEGM